jgi:nucleoside 2-deoxyribosyltransferase
MCYLAGPIDFADDLGKGFRQKIKAIAEEKNLGIIFLDPTAKMDNLKADVGEEQGSINEYKKNGKWERLNNLMKAIVRSDLRCVDYSDFVIAYVDTDIHMCGSYSEIFLSLSQKKPTYIIVKGGRARASSWLFGVCKPEYMFDSIEELMTHLAELNDDASMLSDRWVLIRKQLMSYRKEQEDG